MSVVFFRAFTINSLLWVYKKALFIFDDSKHPLFTMMLQILINYEHVWFLLDYYHSGIFNQTAHL